MKTRKSDIFLFVFVAILWGVLFSEALADCEEQEDEPEYDYYIVFTV